MIVSMMADRSSMLRRMREFRSNWSFSTILCRDFDRPEWVRTAKVALHYKLFSPERNRVLKERRQSRGGRVMISY